MTLLIEHIKPEYLIIIGVSILIILSFIFNYISQKTNIPSVLLLMSLGVAIQYIFPKFKDNPLIFSSLIVVGKVGLILIVLEAALDLKFKKEKIKLIVKSFLMALLCLFGSAILIAYIIQLFLDSSFYNAFVYAIPLSILSSAIIIPSVSSLKADKKEFMIYESTFSDILGIILFQFLVSTGDFDSVKNLIISTSVNIIITIVVAIVFSYIAVWGIQKLTSHAKLFLIIAVLMLIYAIGSVFKLSSLIIILFFGIILNNAELFFRGSLKNYINLERIKPIFKDFYTITIESAFVLRTFFFVIFGLTISLISLVNYKVAFQSIIIVIGMYVVRYIFLKLILWRKSIIPELFIAPRGLITILLFFTIPAKYFIYNFNQGILLYIILISSLIMTISLVASKAKNISDVLHNFDDLHSNIEKSLDEGPQDFQEKDLNLTKSNTKK
ncbi:MAG: cation:proton antiporter [Flavobacteriaceae bacterium]